MIPHEDYYILTAYDNSGRKWSSRCLSPSKNPCSGNLGAVLFSDLDLIECSLKIPSQQKENLTWLKFRIFENIRIPCNAATEIEIKRKGKPSGGNVSRDYVEFSLDDYKFELNSKNNILDFTISKESELLPKYLESRSIEALRFVIARPCDWNTMEICRGKTNKKILIRKTKNKTLKYVIYPPIDLSLKNTDSVWKLFCSFFIFILQYKNPKKLHPISALLQNIILSSTGAIEARILSLVIAIEKILKMYYGKVGAISENEKKDIDFAINCIKDSAIDSRTKKRIVGAVGTWYKASAKTLILKLVQDGLITNDEFDSWDKARNQLAHGEFLKYTDLQYLVDIHSKVLTMFYKLIFNVIRYRGPYVDYGTKGWPIKDFCPNINIKCNIAK